MRGGGSALDIIATTLDTRYGFARRLLNESPHSIELNAEVADRLPVHWEKGRDLEVGRINLAGRVATAILNTDGRKLPVLVSSHGRTVAHPV